jgi:isocitrate/isopropylmalate dehydrogenase
VTKRPRSSNATKGRKAHAPSPNPDFGMPLSISMQPRLPLCEGHVWTSPFIHDATGAGVGTYKSICPSSHPGEPSRLLVNSSPHPYLSPKTIPMAPPTYKIASIPGDGIGVDVAHAAHRLLTTLSKTTNSFALEWNTFDWNSHRHHKTGTYMSDSWESDLKKHDAIFFGAVGWPDIPDHISLWQMILPIRQKMNQFVNVRPTRILKGTVPPLAQLQKKPEDLDWVIVRENSEGEYAGQGGTTHGHTKDAIATETAIFTYTGIERIMRFAFETAKSRPRKKLTMVTKSNAQRHGMVLWDKVFYGVAKEYEGQVEWDKMLVDAMTVRMVNRPESMDVIVATNRKFLPLCLSCSGSASSASASFPGGSKSETMRLLELTLQATVHADILSDLAAALAGSIGIAPSSNLDPTRSCPSMFEPIHGSAPDIAGKGIANPVGAFWSAAEMIR